MPKPFPTIIITRPEASNCKTYHKLANKGYKDRINAPLLIVKPTPHTLPDMPYNATIATSANAITNLNSQALNQLKNLPIFTVGPATSDSARENGFTQIHEGEGKAENLPALIQKQIKAHSNILNIRGREISFDIKTALSDTYTIDEIITYETLATSEHHLNITKALQSEQPNIILLYSKRTAKALLDLIEEQQLEPYLGNTTLLCLSPSMLEYVHTRRNKKRWNGTYSADQPNEPSMFEQLEKITPCK